MVIQFKKITFFSKDGETNFLSDEHSKQLYD